MFGCFLHIKCEARQNQAVSLDENHSKSDGLALDY